MNSKEIVTQIVQWLINYSNKSKTCGYVVGVSGGIDSTLTSSLCAMTGLPTLCVDMPISQNKNEQKRVMSPKNAIDAGADLLVIGRPITDSKDPLITINNILKNIKQ